MWILRRLLRVRPWYLLLLLGLASYLRPAAAPPGSTCTMPELPQRLQPAVVTHVVDGDTFDVRFGFRTARVRLIGVDAPESFPNEKALRDASRSRASVQTIVTMGKEAAAFTRAHLAGRQVGLEFDVQRQDRYGRTLAYVWVGREMFNLVLIREGYAQTYTVPPNVRYASLLLACEREARSAGRGLWR